MSSAVLQQVRPSDNAESSYQAWAAAEAGVDDARARLSADSEYWKSLADFNANPDCDSTGAQRNPALVTDGSMSQEAKRADPSSPTTSTCPGRLKTGVSR